MVHLQRSILLALQVLGWVAFVPLAIWSGVTLIVGLFFLVTGPFEPGRTWEEALTVGGVMFGFSLLPLAMALVTRHALRGLREEELAAPGFEPIMGRTHRS
jgi:hypothetical protein